jgi:hypothetical protein
MAKNSIHYLRFWRDCVEEAFAGSFDIANAWSGLWGPILTWLIFHWQGHTLKLPDQLDLYAIGLVLWFLGTTWMGVVAFRLVGAPARRYAKLQATIPAAPISDLSITLHDGLAYEAMTVDCFGRSLPDTSAWIVRIKNNGNQLLQKCQLFLDDQPVSRHFELRHDEHEDLPVLRLQERVHDPRPIAYLLDPESWKIRDGSGLLVNPGIHNIKVLSADSHPAALNVELTMSAAMPPREWKLRTCV